MALKLQHLYSYSLKLITTCYGNCSLNNVIKNVLKIKYACCHNNSLINEPMISVGSIEPIIPNTKLDATYFHGNDGLGNNNLPEQENNLNENINTAAYDIIKLCLKLKENNEKVVLIMLGPLTNLALAIKLQDNILTYIDELYIMGGCGNGHGNVRRTTEFNMTADCEAASIVFQKLSEYSKLCTIISWELTLAHSIPWTLFDQLNSIESNEISNISSFLNAISQFSYHPNKRIPIPHYSLPSEHFYGAVICDAVAVAVALNSSQLITKSTEVNVDIELKGELTRGQTVVDWGCYDGIVRPKNCRWVFEINQEIFIDMFQKMYLIN